MKKDMKWFKKKLDDIEVNTTSLQNYDAIWMLNRVHELYDQLDEQEVLSQDWIDNHAKAVAYDGMPDETEVVYVDELQNLLVPKQEELEAKIKVLIETYKQEEDAYSNPENGWISGFIEDLKNLVEEEQKYIVELPVTLKHVGDLETLVVPEELGAWLGDEELGDRSCYFTMIRELEEYWITLPVPLIEFIYKNKKELIEVILGSREYKIEEPLYYALVKGHELVKGRGNWVPKYWNYDTTNGAIFISDRNTVRDKYLIKTSKSEWNELGINDSNADFLKVEELEE